MSAPEMHAPLDELLRVVALDERRAEANFPDGWQQGRGAFGGLVTGVLARAAALTAPDRPLRSLTAEICGPVQPGLATLELEVLRAGNAVTTTAVRLLQGGEVLAHGVGVLGKARTDVDQAVLTPPSLPPWAEGVSPFGAPGVSPTFMQHIDFRTTGPLPFSGGSEPVVEGWLRWKRPGTVGDAAFLATCADAHWPTLFSTWATPRPIATVAFTFQPFAHAVDPTRPVFQRARLVAQQAGYCVEFREIWSETGQLLALNQQTFVVIK